MERTLILKLQTNEEFPLNWRYNAEPPNSITITVSNAMSNIGTPNWALLPCHGKTFVRQGDTLIYHEVSEP